MQKCFLVRGVRKWESVKRRAESVETDTGYLPEIVFHLAGLLFKTRDAYLVTCVHKSVVTSNFRPADPEYIVI
jgi:hypothetical protein